MLSSMDKTIALLKNINGVSVSRREVDTIACLLSGKGVKSIALFLGVSPRTIETYVRAITFKFGCNSREGIIRFVEKSDQFSLLKNYYVYLLRQNYFKESLQKIALIAKHNKPVSVVLYKSVTEQRNYFLHQLANYLQLCGINLLIEEKAKSPILNDSVPAIGVICREVDNTDIPIVFILQTNTLPLGVSGETKEKEAAYVNFGDFEKTLEKSPNSFYLPFFDVLKKLLPEVSLDAFLLKFPNNSEDSSDKNADLTKKDNQSSLKDSFSTKTVPSFPLSPKNTLIGTKIIGIILMIFFFLTLASHYEHFKVTCDNPPIRADLPIPHQKVLLSRSQILREIEKSFKKQEPRIKSVTLIGAGGSGKTTISRLYARSQMVPFVWEINAETKESLRNSFKDIAHALSKTPEQKSDLDLIQKISNATEQEKQLLFFVKQRLKEKSPWLLIYDNVESLSDMKDFFPEDQQVWGEGRILVTTRDSNSSNTSYVNPDGIIFIDELRLEDAFALYTKILYDNQPGKLTSPQRENIMHFLQQIPTYPLDISIASYYIKNTQITLTQYLERIKKFTEEFDETQESILKRVNHYTKTRYGIVSASLEEIIESNPNFKELLFLICLMDSQNIPVSLLEACKGELVAEQLLYHLKKHALITHQKESPLNTFSLHRSTQAAGFSFFKKVIKNTDQKIFIDKAVKIIFSLNGLIADNKKPSLFFRGPVTLRVCLFPHLLPFIEHIESLNFPGNWIEEIKGILLLTIGYTHYECFENMLLAQKYFRAFFSKQAYLQHLDEVTLAITLRKLGIICINVESLEEGIQYCQKSLNLCKIPQLSLLKSFNLKHIGLAYAKKNQFEKAISYSRQALSTLDYINQHQRKEMEANIYEQIAGIYSRTYINQPEALQAESYVLKALELLDAVCLFHENPTQLPKLSPYFIAKCRLALGIVYNKLGQYKKAIREGFLEAEYIVDHYMKEDCNFYINTLIDLNFGEALLREGQLEEAEKKLTSSIDVAKKILGSSSQIVRHAKVLRAETLFRLGKIHSAYADCTAILGMNPQYSDPYDALMHLITFYHAAVITHAQGNNQDAEQYLSTFLIKAQTFCELFLGKSAYESLVSQGAFQIFRNIMQPLKNSFQKSNRILTIIYGTSHPFIREYVIKNGLCCKL